MAHPSPYLISEIMFDEAYRSLSSTLCSLLCSPVPLSLLDPNIYLGILFSNTLGVFFSLNVSDKLTFRHPNFTFKF